MELLNDEKLVFINDKSLRSQLNLSSLSILSHRCISTIYSRTYIILVINVYSGLKENLHHGNTTSEGSRYERGCPALFGGGGGEIERRERECVWLNNSREKRLSRTENLTCEEEKVNNNS